MEQYIPRLAEKKIEQSLANKKITILLGARQVGKTTLFSRLLETSGGIILNLDIEVDKARFLAVKNFSPQKALEALGQPKVLVIDEAQRLPEIGRIIKGWFDAKIQTKIFLSGSSSLNLLDKTAEALTGRNEKIYLPPLLFTEILKTQTWFLSNLPALKPQTDSLLLQTLVFGSYPETVITPDKETYLLNLTSDYLLRDVLQPELVRDSDAVKKLLSLLAYQIGSEVSILELSRTLGLSRPTVERYLDLLEQSFVIFRLTPFSRNLRKEIVKNKKIYFWDTGIRNALLKEFNLTFFRSDIGALWENWVIAEFAKKNFLAGAPSNLYFWRSLEGGEVDLIIKGSQTRAVEIKWQSEKHHSSRFFEKTYQIRPKIINRENYLDLII